jgi:pyrroloquinoline quinone biosynthesis protein A
MALAMRGAIGRARLKFANSRETKTVRRRKTMMKWEQPTATDFRFGFEITMYIANR